MLRALVGLLVAGGLMTTLYLGCIGSPLEHAIAAGEGPWQLRELALLKAAYDRTQQETARPTEASASLHAERERIVRQIAETAKLLPAETVPAEVRALVSGTEAFPVSLTPPIETIAADWQQPDSVETPAPDLRVGRRFISAAGSRPAGRLEKFAIDPELREPIGHEPAPEPEERPPRRKPRDTARRNQP